MIPYARQSINDSDWDAIREVLDSDFLTTGPKVEEFESAVAREVGVTGGVAVNSGTAALHTMLIAAGIGPGDQVIVPPMTFAATANAVLYCGAEPVFADVDPGTLLIEPIDVIDKITDATRAIIAVDFGGQMCDYPALHQVARAHQLNLFADACHSLGATWQGKSTAQFVDAACYSFHPVKPLTTAEGGMVVSDDGSLLERAREFRNHGITRSFSERKRSGTHEYDIAHLGYNYRLPDLNCALGISQLKRLNAWTRKRQDLADRYDRLLQTIPGLTPLERRHGHSAWHLYVCRCREEEFGASRDRLFQHLADNQIAANVHYKPVYQHSFYQQLGYAMGLCPAAETAYREIISLPMFATLEASQVDHVVAAIGRCPSARIANEPPVKRTA